MNKEKPFIKWFGKSDETKFKMIDCLLNGEIDVNIKNTQGKTCLINAKELNM